MTFISSQIVHIHLVKKTSKEVLLFYGLLFVEVPKVSLVFLLRILECFDSIVMEVHTVLESLVEHILWIVRGINVSHLSRLHKSIVVVDHSVDHTVSDSLSYDLLSFVD